MASWRSSEIVPGERASTAEIDLVAANVSVFRDGKILRIEFHSSRAKALEAGGLSEQDAHADS